MGVFETEINVKSKTFLQNVQHMEAALAEIKAHIKALECGGGEAYIKKHQARGKLFVRDRIEQLIDKGSYFMELSHLAAHHVYHDKVPAAGIITGIGQIWGKPVMIIANDATVKGGTYYPLTVKKHLRAQEIAFENHLPCVYLVDSGGAFLPKQDEVFPDKNHFGRIFYNQARMSAANIPQFAVVMGSCTAGGAYIPAMSDETIIVKNQGTIFLGGPPLVQAATGEIVTAEALGGGDVHSKISGVADYLAENDQHALGILRDSLKHYQNRLPHIAAKTYKEPRYHPHELYGIIPDDARIPYNVKEIIARLVDDSAFHEFKANYGRELVCCFAEIMGYEVGIIANNGILFSESALKGAHFIELCCQRQIPLIFLQNINGFMVGKAYEHGGIAKDGAKLVMAVSCANVPKLTVIIGGSFGAGNYGMCGRAFGPRFLWMWPNARISVMGGTQAATVLSLLQKEKYESQKKTWAAEEEEAFKQTLRNQYETQGHPLYSTARLWDDGIIDPAQTRTILGLNLEICHAYKTDKQKTQFGVFRM